ncbi:MAG: preprotein translocase subunit YajC [Lachnospiraceae bacterium]|nr:preprotein translocase subunit YajC [Lachnospiraceae bacterium]
MNTALTILAASEGSGGSGGSAILMMVGYIVVIGLFMYFLMIRPQKKQQDQMKNLLSTLETGDSVLTTAGFYGVVIDINDDVVIVEFGNNKNCRIPMQKSAIVDIEKAEDGMEK